MWCTTVPRWAQSARRYASPSTARVRRGRPFPLPCADFADTPFPPFLVQVPAWCFVFCAVGLFLYQTLDNIDGKQARRTSTSGAGPRVLHRGAAPCASLLLPGSFSPPPATETANPLGELFDHGCDAISTVVVIVAYLAAVRVSIPSACCCCNLLDGERAPPQPAFPFPFPPLPLLYNARLTGGRLPHRQSGTGTLGFTTYLVSIVLYYVVHWDCYVKGRLLFETYVLSVPAVQCA